MHRGLMTILMSLRSLKPHVDVDLSTITNPCKGDFDISSEVNNFWRSLGYPAVARTVPRALRWNRFHFTTKSGPNGHAM